MMVMKMLACVVAVASALTHVECRVEQSSHLVQLEMSHLQQS